MMHCARCCPHLPPRRCVLVGFCTAVCRRTDGGAPPCAGSGVDAVCSGGQQFAIHIVVKKRATGTARRNCVLTIHRLGDGGRVPEVVGEVATVHAGLAAGEVQLLDWALLRG